MKKQINTLLILATLASLFFMATTSFLTLRYYQRYRIDPPTSTPNSEKCPVDGLVAHWKLDESIDGISPDSSGQHNHARFKYWFNDLTRFVFGAPKVINGINGNGLEFKGRQWITGGNNSCFTAEQFTISAWVWQERDDMEVPSIMSKGSWPYDGWWLCSTTPGIRDIDVGIGYGSGFTHVKSGFQLPLKEWHHIAVSMDNIKHEAQFYIDGKIGVKRTGVPKWLTNWNHDLFLGEFDGSGRWPWYGKLDDLRFYNKVLSSEEAQAIYTPPIKGEIH
jgi:hypothetical protein